MGILTPQRPLRKIDKSLDRLDSQLDGLYNSIYRTRVDDRKGIDSIFGTIDDELDSLLKDVNSKDISDISALYLRLQKDGKGGQQDMNGDLEQAFEQFTGISTSAFNVDAIRKCIQAEDYQYDLICKYMPILEDALEVKKDNTLSADNFSKTFVYVVNNKKKDVQFNNRINVMKEKYNIEELFDDMVYKASKYGEYFLYQVPYQQGLQKLLDRKSAYNSITPKMESTTIFEAATAFHEDSIEEKFAGLDKKFQQLAVDGGAKVELVMEDFGIVPEPIQALEESSTFLKRQHSLNEAYYITENSKVNVVEEEKLSFDDIPTNDGFVDATATPNAGGARNKITEQMNGCVMYEIPRDKIIPIYMDETCIGYLYLRVKNNYMDTLMSNGTTFNTLTTTISMMANQLDKQNDDLVARIASLMSNQITAKFINNNVDLKEQIYAVLRYNDDFNATQGTNTITVSFIPPQDIHHFYFRMDKKTHRGISDLAKGIEPAMMYILAYMNYILGLLNRANDKRVYYVQQNVDTNVSKTMQNVIAQIKMGNMGMRQLQNMNSIFNIIGRYNDLVIPIGPNGEAPIKMEMMDGQRIDPPTDIMEKCENAAVSTTDVPLEFVQATNQVDYASRFTMSNSKFLRKIFKRQGICQRKFNPIIRNCYNYEYLENESGIKCLLPAPAYLAMTNSAQLINNIADYVKGITENTLESGLEDEVKEEFKSIACRQYLGTYVDFDQVDSMIQQAKMNLQLRKEVATTDGGEASGEEPGGDNEW